MMRSADFSLVYEASGRTGNGRVHCDDRDPPNSTRESFRFIMRHIIFGIVLLTGFAARGPASAEDPSIVVNLWGDQTPEWNAPDQDESDTSTPDSRQVAGKSVVRIGNVTTAQLHVYPSSSTNAESTIVIAPGGGYSILAWDLEGTEVAQWLNGIGVHAVVLKYRVPTRSEDQNWKPAVQDLQRAVSLVRSGNVPGVAKKNVGVLGFSAGGNASARALTSKRRHYDPVDESDKASYKPDFGVLIYPAWLVDKDDTNELIPDIVVDETTGPAFFAHAIDDRVDCLSSVTMFAKMKKHGLKSSLHVFSAGGHGFGLRTADEVTDQWPGLCEAWLKSIEAISE